MQDAEPRMLRYMTNGESWHCIDAILELNSGWRLFLSSPEHRCDECQSTRAHGQAKRLPGSGLQRKTGSAAGEVLIFDQQNEDKGICS